MSHTDPDLVSHYGEVIHFQITDINSDFPQGLSSICVEQDPEALTLLVQRLYSLADLLKRLTTRRWFSIQLYTELHRLIDTLQL